MLMCLVVVCLILSVITLAEYLNDTSSWPGVAFLLVVFILVTGLWCQFQERKKVLVPDDPKLSRNIDKPDTMVGYWDNENLYIIKRLHENPKSKQDILNQVAPN